MWQFLILVSVIISVYILTKINSQSRKALKNNRTKTEIVKCKVCNLNIPQTEAIRVDGAWCCEKKHIH